MMEEYIILPKNILRDKNLSIVAKLVYGIVVGLTHQKGYCYASNSYMANELNVTNRTIMRAINELVEASLIEKDISKEYGNYRRIRLVTKITLPSDKIDTTLVTKKTLPSDKKSILNNKENNKEEKELSDTKFEEFWNCYGKKVGKAKTKEIWGKIKSDKYDDIIKATKKYTILRPDVIYRKDPERFLKHKIYEDDFLKEGLPNSQEQGGHSFEITIPTI